MARSRFCRVCQDFHDLAEDWPEACLGHFVQHGKPAGFYVISDCMPPIESMGSGRMHDSKSVYRRELRDLGLIELGNERVKRVQHKLPPVGPDIKRAIEELRSR